MVGTILLLVVHLVPHGHSIDYHRQQGVCSYVVTGLIFIRCGTPFVTKRSRLGTIAIAMPA